VSDTHVEAPGPNGAGRATEGVPARRTCHRGTGEYRDEAERLLERAGDTATVFRARARSILIKCPDGCGETLVINLDPRAGKAWTIDTRKAAITLYPSVWREDGCRSHFIIWRDYIIWCGRFDDGNEEPAYDETLEDRVLGALRVSPGPATALDLATTLDELTWDVSRALRRLVRHGRARESNGALRHHFVPDRA
jgi:Family of unknown function (DUF6527)